MMKKEKSKLRMFLSVIGFFIVFAMVTVSCSNDKEPELPETPVGQKSVENSEKTTPPGDVVFTVVEKMPEFPGGMSALMKFIGDHITYPKQAKQAGIQGKVFIRFIVEKDGSVSNVKVLRGIGGGCDEEAMRVVKMLPKWKAGEQNGQKVRVSFNIPIKFSLD